MSKTLFFTIFLWLISPVTKLNGEQPDSNKKDKSNSSVEYYQKKMTCLKRNGELIHKQISDIKAKKAEVDSAIKKRRQNLLNSTKEYEFLLNEIKEYRQNANKGASTGSSKQTSKKYMLNLKRKAKIEESALIDPEYMSLIETRNNYDAIISKRINSVMAKDPECRGAVMLK